MSKITEDIERITEKVLEGYTKMENSIVDGFGKISDKCVEILFTKKGESVEDAKKRLSETGRKYQANKQ